MSLQTRLEALAASVGADIKSITTWRTAARSYSVASFSRVNTLTVQAGTTRFPISFPCSILSVTATLDTAPTGSSVIVDVNKNGSTIYGTSSNRPTFSIGTNLATVGAHTATSLVSGDYLTVDVDQIGSTVAGSNLVVVITLERVI